MSALEEVDRMLNFEIEMLEENASKITDLMDGTKKWVDGYTHGLERAKQILRLIQSWQV